MPRRLLVLLIVLLVFPAAARADWFPAAPIDGPSADIVAVGNVDLARDGSGAIAYLRNDGGVPHAFVSRVLGGGLAGAGARRPGAGRGDRGQGRGRRRQPARGRLDRRRHVYANVVAGRHAQRRARSPARSQIGGPGRDVARHRPRRQRRRLRRLGSRAATCAPRACRTRPGRPSRTPLDVDPTLEAGTGALRPRVAVSAEGYAVVTWGERDAGGRHARVGAPDHRPQPVRRSRRTLDDRRRRQRRLAGHRHRGRRLVRLGRLPAGPRRRLAHGRAAAGRLARSRRPRRSTAGLAVERAEGRHERRGRRLRGRAGATAARCVVGAWLDHDHFQARRADGRRRQRRRRPSRRSRPPTAATSRSRGATGAAGGAVARARYQAARTSSALGAGVHGLARRTSARWSTRACSSAATASATSSVAMVQGAPGRARR